jgi:hypothetical protein
MPPSLITHAQALSNTKVCGTFLTLHHNVCYFTASDMFTATRHCFDLHPDKAQPCYQLNKNLVELLHKFWLPSLSLSVSLFISFFLFPGLQNSLRN